MIYTLLLVLLRQVSLVHGFPNAARLYWSSSSVGGTNTRGINFFDTRIYSENVDPTVQLPLEEYDHDSQQKHLVLPIFSLRKTVRFPTDPLTLNLYEERYLSMAERILENPFDYYQGDNTKCTLLFGAIYSSDKGQVVTGNGLGPIVPMLQVGDVGTVFQVTNHQDGMIPTRGGDGELRRRIRLESVGIQRFRVDKIKSSGFSVADKKGQAAAAAAGDESKSAFIVAEVSIYCDDADATDAEIPSGGGEQESILELWNTLKKDTWEWQMEILSKKESNRYDGDGDGDGDDDLENLIEQKMSPIDSRLGSYNESVVLDGLGMQSFALASKLMMEKKSSISMQDKIAFLKMQSLRERLDKIGSLLQREKKWRPFG